MSDTYDGRARTGHVSGRSPLFLAALAVFALVLLIFVYVAFFGSEEDGYPAIVLPMPNFAQGQTQTTTQATGAERRVNGNLVFDPALAEDTPLGPLPKVAGDGRRAMDAYAPAVNAADRHPKIALVLVGLGVSHEQSTVALGRLPATITMAFSPYTEGLQTWIDKARGAGHAVLMEVPMEPFDFPDSDPGPRTLLVAASPQQNLEYLSWMLTRGTGYVGAVNSQGGRFLSESSALSPVVGYLGKHGLLWVDVSSGDNSATAPAANREKAPVVAGALRIDAIQTPEAIDAKLLELEDRAKGSGVAVGVGSAYPVSIDRIAEWTANVEAHGFVLVPVTAAATRPDLPRR